ncbi:MAG: hypothetical protein Q7T74_03435 [Candidatus Saccharibacteria bacterium]|nr:hypothetical protein [Candidatus Saccharibacteria bacterium]
MDKEDKGSPDLKQQISERIKEVSNILVTVSKNPTVDELSAALGLTLMLNKMDKHATAVFSGAIPPAIEFLEPDKTLENNVDSLRDFIIAIDKEKADRLRYKIEGDVVRIFITPYRTNISQEDLEFTHGDFNVELVLALGVESQDVLDEAISAHGKILHDATVATINAQNKTSNLGSIDWRDENASSLSEMLVTLGESFKDNVLDEQIATALLTGIVAATDRFSNNQTSSKSMTIAAQLMAAGANQQLIASKLESASEISVAGTTQEDGAVKLDEGKSGKIRENEAKPDGEALGQIQIEHDKKEVEDTSPQLPAVEAPSTPESKDKSKPDGAEALDAALEKLGATNEEKNTEILHAELESASEQKVEKPKSPLIGHSKPSGMWSDPNLEEPTMGGALNSTVQDVAEDKKHEEEANRNRTILSHDAAPSTRGKNIEPEITFAETPAQAPTPTVMDIQVTNNEPKMGGTLSDIEAGVGAHQIGVPSLPPVPPPPLPDFSSLPPLPPAMPTQSTQNKAPTPIPPPQTVPAPANIPDQFKIPGQQTS